MVSSLSIITTSYIIERSIPCRKSLTLLATLARNLISNTCAKMVVHLKQIITSPVFIVRHKQHETDFTCQRKLPFHVLIVFCINFVRGSYQDELDKFFKTICRFDVPRRIVSKAALTKARMKLRYQAFMHLNLRMAHFFEKSFKPHTWCGFRLLAINGSTARLPMEEEIAQHFGAWNCRHGSPSPMARVSQLFDVLNKIAIDAIIKPKGIFL